jgi:ribonucleotide monophosphatase NagD (HAD superfamily)
LIAEAYGGIVFDIDGVLIRGDTPVPGAAETLAALDSRGIATVFITNNASRTPEEIAAWLHDAGLAIDTARVVTSALAAAALLEPGTRCLVIGMAGVREALAGRGCVLDNDPETAEAVVVGFDRSLCWDDLRRAGDRRQAKPAALRGRRRPPRRRARSRGRRPRRHRRGGSRAVGWDCALVLTGVTTREAARTADPRPTYVLDQVADLLA